MMGSVAAIALLHEVGEFSWTSFTVHPSTLIGCAAFAGLYLAGIGPLRRKYHLSDTVDRTQTLSFLLGVFVLFFSLNGPIHDLSDYFLLSAHMVQHLLLMMVAVPLLLVGTPAWLLRPLLKNRVVHAIARFLTGPFIAYTIYNLILVVWHFPTFYNTALENHNVHIAQHLMMIAGAVLMWWPIVNPVPELERIGSPMRMIYLFALGFPMTIISALITLSDKVLYPWYAEAPRVFESLSALYDQQLAGLIMWVPGMLVFWTATTVVFFRWSRREERAELADRQALLGA